MTSELDLAFYGSIWVAATGTILLMTKWLRDSIESRFHGFAEKIDRKNADLGLDNSIDPGVIALDYLIPWRGNNIARYAKRNDFPVEQYLAELDHDVGKSRRLIVSILLLVTMLAFALSGPLVYYHWGLSYASEYMAALIALAGLNAGAYLIP